MKTKTGHPPKFLLRYRKRFIFSILPLTVYKSRSLHTPFQFAKIHLTRREWSAGSSTGVAMFLFGEAMGKDTGKEVEQGMIRL